MTTGITKRSAVKLFQQTIKLAWRVGAKGQRGSERLLMAVRHPPFLLWLYTAMQATEETLEALVEATAGHLGIHMADVLEPMIAAWG